MHKLLDLLLATTLLGYILDRTFFILTTRILIYSVQSSSMSLTSTSLNLSLNIQHLTIQQTNTLPLPQFLYSTLMLSFITLLSIVKHMLTAPPTFSLFIDLTTLTYTNPILQCVLDLLILVIQLFLAASLKLTQLKTARLTRNMDVSPQDNAGDHRLFAITSSFFGRVSLMQRATALTQQATPSPTTDNRSAYDQETIESTSETESDVETDIDSVYDDDGVPIVPDELAVTMIKIEIASSLRTLFKRPHPPAEPNSRNLPI